MIFNIFTILLLIMLLSGCSSPFIADNNTWYFGLNKYDKKPICENVEYVSIKNLGVRVGRDTGIGYVDKKATRVDLEHIKEFMFCKTPIVNFYHLGV